jgi:hypothetical protein
MNPRILLFAIYAMLFLKFQIGYSQVINTCTTDFNNDAITYFEDYYIFKPYFGKINVKGQAYPTDLNKNGKTDIDDYCVFINDFGRRSNVVIFNMSAAIYCSNYVDVPVSISSDNSVNIIEFEMKIKDDKLTSIPSLNKPEPFVSWNYKNIPLLYKINYSGTSNDSIGNDKPLIYIRFSLKYTPLKTCDFNSISTFINKTPAGYIVK